MTAVGRYQAPAVDDGVEAGIGHQRHGALVAAQTDLKNAAMLFVLAGKANWATAGRKTSNGRFVPCRRPFLLCHPFYAATLAMVAFEGSITTRKGVKLIAASSLFKGFEFHTVMAGPNTPTSSLQLDWRSDVLERVGLKAKTRLVGSAADKVLPAYAADNGIDF